jgi:uncharacterized 2Fe-2S/4Fe-4S cluster protein (DUF4445 family)
MNAEVIEIEAAGLSRESLTDLLLKRGIALNARCGQRGICRGCMVDLVDGGLIGPSGETVTAGQAVRSCQMRLPSGGKVRVRIHEQARISSAPQVGETFRVDIPCELSPWISAKPGKDTGFAVDVGTTTVVVLLADLNTGEVLARAGDFSAQIRYGDNVVTRIGAASRAETRREMCRALVDETLSPLLDQACGRAGRDRSRLAGGTIAGNTTMLHILADEDPSPLGIAPFTPRFLESRVLQASDLGLKEEIPLLLLPGLSAYVGADITAGVHATGMTFDKKPSLLVDLGTNGEIVLAAGGRLIGCATAAGPAFEGCGLSYGTRAQDGAVSGISMTADPLRVKTRSIGDGPARAGMCGSAYVDFLALGRAHGLILGNGRFDRALWARLSEKQRLETDDGLAFRLPGAMGPAVSEIDIAQLLQAKAAIGAGIGILLGSAGIAPAEIGRVYLAGGFGMHVNVGHAIDIGLLPGFRPDQVRVVGNTALAGALLGLLDRTALVEMEALRERMEVVELNAHPDFEDAYIDHLSLP